MLFVVFACQKLGLEMACCNDAFTPYELAHSVKTVKPAAFITMQDINERLKLAGDSAQGVTHKVILTDPTSSLWEMKGEAPKRKVGDEQETCLLAFTSGTSGLPKVAMIPLEGFNKSLLSVMVSTEMFMDSTKQLRLLLFLPVSTKAMETGPDAYADLAQIYHGSGLMQSVAGMMAGVHLVFCVKRPFDMRAILQVSAQYQIQVSTTC
jgi:acyl-CoA synthetase (AMP-forming)/AMP-acid ligase II